MKISHLCFLFMVVLSILGVSTAATGEDGVQETPTSLFKATTYDGRQVYVLGTNHTRPVRLEPESLVTTLEELSRRHPDIAYIVESGGKSCAEDCFFCPTFLKYACYQDNAAIVAALENDYGNKDAFETEKRKLKELVDRFLPIYAEAGKVDGQFLKDLHPIPFFAVLLSYSKQKEKRHKRNPKDESMDDCVHRLFSKKSSKALFLETDDIIYGCAFHESFLKSSRLFSDAIAEAELMLDEQIGSKKEVFEEDNEENLTFEGHKRQPRSTENVEEGGDGLVGGWLYPSAVLRNRAWKTSLHNYFNSTPKNIPSIVCVGIGHLPGETGVFKMLEQYGIQDAGITQLMANGDWRPI